MLPLKQKRIWISGHNGMVGQALKRRLEQDNCTILTVEKSDVDLTRQEQVENWMAATKPELVIVAAAKVGGILANNRYPAPFLYDNLMIASNIVHASYKANVQKLLFLGSSCIYPRDAKQPLEESFLLSGPLEPTNQWYALAKIAGLKLTEAYRRQHGCDFISAMPTNLYGQGDTYHLENSHVIPALIMKIHTAKKNNEAIVPLWGTGKVLREFLYVDDLADACTFLLQHYSGPDPINIGTGQDMTIADLAATVADVIGYKGRFAFDPEKPSGTPRKLLDISKIKALGWTPRTSLKEGLKKAYEDYLGRYE